MSVFTFALSAATLEALARDAALNDALARRIGNAMQEAMNQQMEEALFGGRKMPNQAAITESVIVAPRKARKHPFGIINFEDAAG